MADPNTTISELLRGYDPDKHRREPLTDVEPVGTETDAERATMTVKSDTTVSAVCTDCAERAGGVWIENRGTTFWSGECEVCGKQEALCAPRDFRWPNGHRPTEWSVQS